MTDFVLEQEQPTYLEKEEFEDVYYKIHNYANFLKKPLELGMFVPCDENGDILRDGVNWNKNFYQRAKERVLFEGFELKKETDSLYFLTYDSCYMFFIPKDKKRTIENIICKNFTLTPNAIKQLS